jgi:hypothetical protein
MAPIDSRAWHGAVVLQMSNRCGVRSDALSV